MAKLQKQRIENSALNETLFTTTNEPHTKAEAKMMSIFSDLPTTTFDYLDDSVQQNPFEVTTINPISNGTSASNLKTSTTSIASETFSTFSIQHNISTHREEYFSLKSVQNGTDTFYQYFFGILFLILILVLLTSLLITCVMKKDKISKYFSAHNSNLERDHDDLCLQEKKNSKKEDGKSDLEDFVKSVLENPLDESPGNSASESCAFHNPLSIQILIKEALPPVL